MVSLTLLEKELYDLILINLFKSGYYTGSCHFQPKIMIIDDMSH